jgi:CheY-like chemotaxis protein
MNIEAKTYTDYQMLLNDEPLDFDIVLTDIEMPVYSGFQILASLMAGDLNSYNKQPVIAMTGARKFPKKEYLQAGFSDLLQKPFSKNQLIDALNPLFLNELTTHLPELAIYKNSSNEVFDLAFLESFLSSQASINEVLAIFYEQTEKDMEHIEQAIKNCDCELMESISHRMLTMCRQLSAKRVNPILETMEQCAKEKATAADMEMLYANLKIEIHTLIEALQKREEITI